MRIPAPLLSSFLFLPLFLTAALPAWAGPLTGRIVDPDGRAVAGAAVVLTDGASIVTRATTTSSGQFSIDAPDSGEFEIRVVLDGFGAAPRRVAPGAAARDIGTITLHVSAVSEAIVVSAAQVEIPLSSATSSVTVITREDLDAHQVESVAEALRSVPGLTVTSSGSRGAQTSVFPRGGESDYTLVYIDGIQANTFGGGYDFGHLPVVNIERIEIVRGPQSALYGSNAIGSVIRIVTRRGGAPMGSALAEGGSSGTSRVAAASSGEIGAWHWGAAAERLASDGYNGDVAANGQTIENDDYERKLISAAGGWRRGRVASLRGDVRHTTDDRGFPGPFGSDPGGTYGGIDTVSRGSNTRWLSSVGGSFQIGRARINTDVTHSRLDSEAVSRFGDSESWSRRTTGRMQADTTFAHGLETSAGFEWLGERAGGTFVTATGNALVPVERGMTGAFGEARWNHNARLFVNAGLRVERITRRALPGDADGFPPRPSFDDDTVVSANPKVSAAWYLRSADGNFTKVRGSAGTGIRPPDAFEIAFTDNPSLRPERSRSIEAGVDQAVFGGRALIEATAFFNGYDDLIVATRTFSDVSRYSTDNISNARSRGLEIAGTARARLATVGAGLHVRVGYTLLDTEILAVDRGGSAPPPFTVGDRLIRRPGNQVSVDAVLDAGRLTAFLQGNARTGVRDIDPSFGAPPFGAFHDAPGYHAWNVGASWRLVRNLDVFGRVTNLFNEGYEEAFGFPARSRSGIVGLKVAAGR